MNVDQATDLVRQALMVALIVAGPMLILGLVVGVLISIFQALTQIQEQTLVFVPKIVVMGAAAIVLLPWIGQKLIDFTKSMLETGTLP